MIKTADATVLITGATGAVGPRVVQEFLEAGNRVRTFSIDASHSCLWPDSVKTLTGDITDESAVQSAMQGVDAGNS